MARRSALEAVRLYDQGDTGGVIMFFFFFQAEDGIRDLTVTGVQTCALPISPIGESQARNDDESGMEEWKEGRGRAGGDPWILTGWAPLPYRRSCERRTYAVGKEQDASGVISTVCGPRSGIRAVVGSGGPPV